MSIKCPDCGGAGWLPWDGPGPSPDAFSPNEETIGCGFCGDTGWFPVTWTSVLMFWERWLYNKTSAR